MTDSSPNFCRVLDAEDLAGNAAYRTNEGRVQARAAVCDRISELTAGWTREALLAALESQGIPAGPINDIADVFADPQVIARGLRRDLASEAGPIPTVACPIVIDGERMVADRASPRLGADTEAVLAELIQQEPRRAT